MPASLCCVQDIDTVDKCLLSHHRISSILSESEHAVAWFGFYLWRGKKMCKAVLFFFPPPSGIVSVLLPTFLISTERDSMFCSRCCQETPWVWILESLRAPISSLLWLWPTNQTKAWALCGWAATVFSQYLSTSVSPWGAGGWGGTLHSCLPVRLHPREHARMGAHTLQKLTTVSFKFPDNAMFVFPLLPEKVWYYNMSSCSNNLSLWCIILAF